MWLRNSFDEVSESSKLIYLLIHAKKAGLLTEIFMNSIYSFAVQSRLTSSFRICKMSICSFGDITE